MGIVKIQIFARKTGELIQNLKMPVTACTQVKGEANVSIIYSIIKRTEIHQVEDIIKATNPKSFYSVEDVKLCEVRFFLCVPTNAGGEAENSRVRVDSVKLAKQSNSIVFNNLKFKIMKRSISAMIFGSMVLITPMQGAKR